MKCQSCGTKQFPGIPETPYCHECLNPLGVLTITREMKMDRAKVQKLKIHRAVHPADLFLVVLLFVLMILASGCPIQEDPEYYFDDACQISVIRYCHCGCWPTENCIGGLCVLDEGSK